MIIADILLAKGTEIETIRPSATLRVAVRRLVGHNVDALVVCEVAADLEVLGIISAREIVYAQARGGIDQEQVLHAMATDVPAVSPADSIEVATQLMSDGRTRHLLVFDNGEFRTIISIVDLLYARYRELMSDANWATTRSKPC